jgi:GLPGLI family protein
MKKLVLASLFAMAATVSSFAQDFEGKVVMKMSYDVPSEMKGQEAMLPAESVAYYKKKNSRIETNSMFGSQIFIVNEKKESTLLLDMMGMKFAVPMDIPEEAESDKPKITYEKSGGKTIAGYKCKKAIVKYADEEMEVYYTEELKAFSDKISGLKGFPMEYTTNSSGMKVKTTVTEVKKETVSDDKFTIPDDFQVMSLDELQRMLSGGGDED